MSRVNSGSKASARLALITMVLSSTALTPIGVVAQELPAGGQVSSGSATIQGTANGLLIDQTSHNAIINWSDFSIGAGGSVVFNNGSGATLNRVTGSNISRINGSLSATGSLYLVNRNGVVIGKDGVINTGGSFVASTLDIRDQDFLDGGDMTFSGDNSATVINQGRIGSLGGDVALISRHIVNEGTLEAPGGTVGLAAGREVLLRDAALDDGKFLVKVGDADSSITEAGVIKAANAELRAHGGNIYALAGNTGGAISVTGSAKSGGRLFLTAGGGTVRVSKPVRATRRAASGAGTAGRASSIVINADIVSIGGLLQASPADGKGGSIEIGGRDISLEGAQIDVSGVSGGGDIRIGGAWQGGDFGALTTAVNVSLDETTLLTANATQSGDGGEVVVWSDSFTQFAGKIEARGAGTGKGGDAEVSGKAKLAYSGFTDLSAESGTFGNLLLDPYNVTISDEAAANSSGTAATGDDSIITVATLEAALAGANVEITTSPSGGTGMQAGDILVADDVTWSADTTLTLSADNDIGIFADVTATGANAGLALNYGGDYIVPRGASVTLSGSDASLDINGQSYDLIHSMAELDAIDTTGMAGHYALAMDLDAAGTTYTNSLVGNGSGSTIFTGVFAGLGHVISDLTIHGNNSVAHGTMGLFRSMAGTVRDIGVENADVSLTHDSVSLGILVGVNSGAIYNAHVSGSISGTATGTNLGTDHASVGGLVASNHSYASGIQYSTADVDVTAVAEASAYAGGLIGNSGSSVDHSSSTGNVSGRSLQRFAAVGGLVGDSSGILSNVFATGNVSSSGASTGYRSAGGLVGFLSGHIDIGSASHVENAYATGNVSASGNTSAAAYAGGLVGYENQGAKITTSYAVGNVQASGNQFSGAGGLVGRLYDSSISSSFFDSGTTGRTNAVGTAGGTNSVSTTGLTTAQARDAGNYTGWDFTNDWYQAGDMRPILRSEAGNTLNGVTPVTNLHQLALISTDMAGSYLMTKDIDASLTNTSNAADIWNSTGWVPLGKPNPNLTHNFMGTFDGNGHTVSELTINRPAVAIWTGLFGTIGQSGLVADIGLKGGSVVGRQEVGMLAGSNYEGTIVGAYATGTVTGSGDRVGGLVGGNSGSISDAYATGTVAGSNRVGGLVGSNSGAINNVFATGDVAGSASAIGGLVGWNANSTISDAYANGSVIGDYNVGGLVGNNSGSSTISNVYATGTVSGYDILGGLVGNNNDSSTISDAYATGAVNGIGFGIGGLAGYNYDSSTITGSHATGSVMGSYQVGGLVGRSYESEIADSFATGNVDGSNANGYSPVGGLVGEAELSLISRSYATGNAIGYSGTSNARVGGLVGYAVDSDIIDSYASGNATATSYFDSLAGGLVGFATTETNIQNAYATGNAVSTTNETSSSWAFAGGLVGWLSDATISDAFATGNATSNSHQSAQSGGLVGYSSNGSVVSRAFATGLVIANVSNTSASEEISAIAGGLIGVNRSTIVDAYVPIGSDVYAYTGSTGIRTAYAGGIAGANYGAINRTYALGNFSASAPNRYLGSIAGLNSGTVSSSFAYLGTSAIGDNTGTVTDVLYPQFADLQDTDVFMAAASAIGWDFDTVWAPPSAGYYAELYSVNPVVWVEDAITTSTYGDSTGTITSVTSHGGPASFVFGPGSDLLDLTGATVAVDPTENAGTTNSTLTSQNVASTSDKGQAYRVFYHGSSTKTVDKAALLITAADASKTYGQTANLTGYAVSGLVAANGDSVSGVDLASLGAPSTADAGSYAIAASNAAGHRLNNYDISYADGTLTVDKAALLITAADASKTYGDTANLTGYSVSGLVDANGDSVTNVDLASAGAASTADAGNYGIIASNASGNRLNNYDISYADGTLTVDKAALLVTASDDSKTYGETASLTGYTVLGLVDANGDSVSGVDLASAGAASTADAGSYAITASNASGNRLNNYDISYADGTLTVDKAALLVTASDDSKTYGQTASLTGYTVLGLVDANGDSVSGVDLASAGAASTADAGNYAIAASNATGNRLGNYDISYADGTLSVDKAALTVAADDKTKVYGSQNPLLTWQVVAGALLNGDSLSGDLATDADEASPAGTYAITRGTLDNTNYQISYLGGVLLITPMTTPTDNNGLPGDFGPDNPTPADWIASTQLPGMSCDQDNDIGNDENLTELCSVSP